MAAVFPFSEYIMSTFKQSLDKISYDIHSPVFFEILPFRALQVLRQLAVSVQLVFYKTTLFQILKFTPVVGSVDFQMYLVV